MRELVFGRKGAPLGQAKALVVLLHGYGADGQDLLSIADYVAEQVPDYAFIAPDAPDACMGNPFGRQWFGIPRFDGSTFEEAQAGMHQAAEDLNAFLDARLKEEGLEPQNLFLLGFSQGAMMSLQVAPRRTPSIAGVVAISGRLVAPELLASQTVSRPPIMLVHGDQDDVVPFESMDEAAKALADAGFPIYGHVMQGTGHGISNDGLGAALSFIANVVTGKI